jgi:hypothetical protein
MTQHRTKAEQDIAARFERYLTKTARGQVIPFVLRNGETPQKIEQNEELLNELRRQGRAKDPG